MNSSVKSRIAVISMSLLVAAASVAAAGQPQAPGAGQARTAEVQQGPLVVEPIDSGFLFTPEVKFTKVNGSNATLVGGYAGWLASDTFFLGAGGYGLVNGKYDTRMDYGGVVAGWTAPVGGALRLGVRGLFGYGDSRLAQNVTVRYYLPVPYGTTASQAYVTGVQQVRFSQNFLVFEPQVTAVVRFGHKVALDIAGGYRVIGDAGGWDKQLRGGFGSVGVRFGPF